MSLNLRWLGIRLEIIGGMITFFACIFAVIQRGTISAGIAGLSISYALGVSWPLRNQTLIDY